MKKLLPLFFITCGLITMSSSCNNKINSSDSQSEIEQKTEEVSQIDKPEMTPHNMEEDCHGVRKTVRTITDKEGEIMLIGNNVTISIPPGSKRFKGCDEDIPKELKIEGLKVRFSGEVLEIFSNERLMGTPIRLTKIHIIK
ncbi:MAG: hypothetical protein ACJA1A_000213 [Saprospiraceae bacterium]|jgi:hypothetical protein|tara:strand:+ start:957 stop:1379 length:423 start_codon:yes stop_codon:yes gene_type:complete